MGWNELDLFDFQVSMFESQINEIVVPLFDATDRNLTEWQRRIDADYDDAISKVKHEADETNAKGEAAYRGSTVGEQRQLIGAACLGFVATAVKVCLDDMARWFKDTHPPSREYAGKGWLQKRQDEYQQRFQIDFCKSPTLGSVEELILARNAGLHWDSSALDEYGQRVKSPRFIEHGFFTVERDNFLKIITEVRSFVAWVHAELTKLRPKLPAAQK